MSQNAQASWSTITSIGHGSLWCANSFNYDDHTRYPPGLVKPSSSRSRYSSRDRCVDDRNALVQIAMMGGFEAPWVEMACDWCFDFRGGRVRVAAESTQGRSRGSSVSISTSSTGGSGRGNAGEGSGFGTPTSMTEWVVGQAEGSELGSSSEKIISGGDGMEFGRDIADSSAGSEFHPTAPQDVLIVSVSSHTGQDKAAWNMYAARQADAAWEAYSAWVDYAARDGHAWEAYAAQHYWWQVAEWWDERVGTY